MIKAYMVEQNTKSNLFCLPYSDAGKYKIRVFTRNSENICQVDDLNEQLGVSVNQNGSYKLMYSSIFAIFLDDSTLFVSLYDFAKKTNWLCKLDIATKKVHHTKSVVLKASKPFNFLMKSLYDAKN